MRFTSSECPAIRSPTQKNVARTFRPASNASKAGVFSGSGPSSKVRATALRSVRTQQMLSPNICHSGNDTPSPTPRPDSEQSAASHQKRAAPWTKTKINAAATSVAPRIIRYLVRRGCNTFLSFPSLKW